MNDLQCSTWKSKENECSSSFLAELPFDFFLHLDWGDFKPGQQLLQFNFLSRQSQFKSFIVSSRAFLQTAVHTLFYFRMPRFRRVQPVILKSVKRWGLMVQRCSQLTNETQTVNRLAKYGPAGSQKFGRLKTRQCELRSSMLRYAAQKSSFLGAARHMGVQTSSYIPVSLTNTKYKKLSPGMMET